MPFSDTRIVLSINCVGLFSSSTPGARYDQPCMLLLTVGGSERGEEGVREDRGYVPRETVGDSEIGRHRDEET